MVSLALQRRLALAAIITAAAASAAASPASAALTTARTISPVSQSAQQLQLSLDANGDAVAEWDPYPSAWQVSLRPAGGSWDAAPAALGTAGDEFYSRDVVIDDAGNATAIWVEAAAPSGFPPMPGPAAVYTASRPAGGSWSAATQLSNLGVDAGAVSALAVAPDGTVTALWEENSTLTSATRSANGSWSASSPISGNTNEGIEVATDADGTITAAWEDATTSDVMTASLQEGGSWTTPVDVSNGNGWAPALAMDSDGDATIAYQANTKEMAVRRPSTGASWGSPTQVSIDGAGSYYQPEVAVDARGRAVVAWSEYDSGSYNTVAAVRSEAGAWGPATTLGAGASDPPSVAGGGDGSFGVVWHAFTSAWVTFEATLDPVASTFGSPVQDDDLASSSEPVAAADGQGNLLFGAVNSSDRVVVKADDTAGPQLHEVSIPATATVGTPVRFSVSPLDVWSGLGPTSWDFGDGSTMIGFAPGHTYLTPGTKTVTVTATDALAQATTQTGTVVVSAPPRPTATPVPPSPTPQPPTATPTPTVPVKPSVCASRRVITLHFGVPAGQKARSITLDVSGRKTRTLAREAREVTVDLRGVSLPTVNVTVRVRTTRGKLATDARSYKTCGR